MAPVGLDFDEELEEYFCAEDEFEFFARCCADFFDGFPALADQNSLLAFALDVDGGADAQQLGRFLEIIYQDGDGVRHFVARGEDGFFAHDFGGEETFGLVGELVGREMRRGFGQAREPGIDEVEAAGAGERGNGENFGELEFLVVAFDQREEQMLGDAVHFIQQQVHGTVKTLNPFDGEAVAGAVVDGRVGDEAEDVNAFEGVLEFVHHHAAEDVSGLVDAGRVYQDDLGVVAIQDALNAIAGGLGLGRDDGDFLADERIDERGFAGVGTPDDRDETGLEGHGCKNCTPLRCGEEGEGDAAEDVARFDTAAPEKNGGHRGVEQIVRLCGLSSLRA